MESKEGMYSLTCTSYSTNFIRHFQLNIYIFFQTQTFGLVGSTSVSLGNSYMESVTPRYCVRTWLIFCSISKFSHNMQLNKRVNNEHQWNQKEKVYLQADS